MSVQRFEIPVWECYDLLASRTVGRLCVVDHGYPLAFPVNYRVAPGDPAPRVVVRTSPHSIIARHEGPSAIEVDDIDETRRAAWSVIARGLLRRVSGPHELPDPEPWLDDGRHTWLVLEVNAVSGRRFEGRPGSNGFAVEWHLAQG